MQGAIPAEQQVIGLRRIGDERIVRMPGCNLQRPGGHAGQEMGDIIPVGKGAEQGGGNADLVDQGLRQCRAPRLFGDQDVIDQAKAKAPLILGNGQAGQAHVDQLLPAGGGTSRAAGGFAHLGRAAFAGQEIAHRVAEQQLVFGEGEVHGIPLNAAGSTAVRR